MKALDPLKATVKTAWKTILPRSYWRHRYNLLVRASHEVELQLVPYLCNPDQMSVDIGAAAGVFSARMCRSSRQVVAFEPRPRQAAELSAMASTLGLPIQVEGVALSNKLGTAQLRMLVEDVGRSTIEAENTLEDEDGSAKAQISVPMRRLDDYELQGVAMIKIDVEGHEVSVLEGARETIGRNRPTLLIESEDRHRKNAVADVTSILEAQGYAGFFLQDGSPHPIHEFDLAIHQDCRNIGGWKSHWERCGIYINNFFFLPVERQFALDEAVRTSRLAG